MSLCPGSPDDDRPACAQGPLASLVGGILVGILLLLSGALAARAQSQCIVLEDFSSSTPAAFPTGWQPRKEDGRAVYTVREENGRRFLRAVSQGLGIQAGRSVEWDLDTYPVLAWSWRPGQFAQGADERQAATNDSALAVYLLVPYSQTRGPRAMKYIWSERVPLGTRIESNMGLTQVRVLRSGKFRPGVWIEERVNVLDDSPRLRPGQDSEARRHRRLTDADDTRSTAAGDYANFRACRG